MTTPARKNLQATQAALIEILKANGVMISVQEEAAGTSIRLTDMKDGTWQTWGGTRK